jgi:hypothetical protein
MNASILACKRSVEMIAEVEVMQLLRLRCGSANVLRANKSRGNGVSAHQVTFVPDMTTRK